jgi:hypothetical protein
VMGRRSRYPLGALLAFNFIGLCDYSTWQDGLVVKERWEYTNVLVSNASLPFK